MGTAVRTRGAVASPSAFLPECGDLVLEESAFVGGLILGWELLCKMETEQFPARPHYHSDL